MVDYDDTGTVRMAFISPSLRLMEADILMIHPTMRLMLIWSVILSGSRSGESNCLTSGTPAAATTYSRDCESALGVRPSHRRDTPAGVSVAGLSRRQRGVDLCFHDRGVGRLTGFAEANPKPFTSREGTFLGHWCSEARSGVPSAPPGGKQTDSIATAALPPRYTTSKQ